MPKLVVYELALSGFSPLSVDILFLTEQRSERSVHVVGIVRVVL